MIMNEWEVSSAMADVQAKQTALFTNLVETAKLQQDEIQYLTDKVHDLEKNVKNLLTVMEKHVEEEHD